MFFLNADPENSDKLLLAHDLVVKSAQIPERAFLGDTGAVVTPMRARPLLQIVAVTLAHLPKSATASPARQEGRGGETERRNGSVPGRPRMAGERAGWGMSRAMDFPV